jgi:hypothetical protein
LSDRRRRLPAVFPIFGASLLLAGSLLTALVGPASAAAREPAGIDTFMRALAQVESGGRYTARNPRTGAYGKYQILPSTWRGWSRHYLGLRNAPPTPHNQEVVARARVTDLYRSFHRWSAVAHWWLTGRAPTDRRSQTASAGRYVRHVMATYARFAAATGSSAGANGGAAGAGTTAALITLTYDDRHPLVTYSGEWSATAGNGYLGRTATSASVAGATAALSFFGSSIALLGAVGPTLGSATITVDDGSPVTVDLNRPVARRSARLFSQAWPETGQHTITVGVTGTGPYPSVLIDGFLVGR